MVASLSIVSESQRQLEGLRRIMMALLEQGDVPAGDPSEQRVSQALEALCATVGTVARAGHPEVHEEGPFVFPIDPESDPRSWPTSISGQVAADAILRHLRPDHPLQAKIQTGLYLRVPEASFRRLRRYRLLTRSQFLRLLEESQPVDLVPASCN